MQRHILCSIAAAALTVLCSAPSPWAGAAEADDGFQPIFNGKDLTGWAGKPGWWYVEDGAITSQSTPEKPCKKCNYLIWQDGKPADFELRLRYRIVGGNSGVQFRSQTRPDWDTFGYQADIDASGGWTGALFEHARGGIAMRGQKVAIDRDGRKQITPIGDPAELMKSVKKEDWNDYCIIAQGNRIMLKINGLVMSQAVDDQEGRAARDGIIALQMHPGPPMKIQFKDLRIKTLKVCESSGN